MNQKEKIILFKRFIKELGIYHIFLEDYRGRGRVRTFERAIQASIDCKHDAPKQMINFIFYWIDCKHRFIWENLFDVLGSYSPDWYYMEYDLFLHI